MPYSFPYDDIEKLFIYREIACYRYYTFNNSDIVPFSHLKYLEIGDNIQTNCLKIGTDLENIVIGKNVGFNYYFGGPLNVPNPYPTFKHLSNLRSIRVTESEPSFSPTFAHDTYLYGVLYVPKGSLETYKNAQGWKDFWDIIEYEAGVEDIPVNSVEKTECGRYDLNGRPVSDNYNGITIIKYNDGTAKKILPIGDPR